MVSLLKRWLRSTHEGPVGDKHLDYYLDEFCFRFNRRHSRRRGLLFLRLLENAVRIDPLPYEAIVKRTGKPHPRRASNFHNFLWDQRTREDAEASGADSGAGRHGGGSFGSLRTLKIGLGLPNSDKSLHDGRLLVDIARRAEELGFSTLATIGRVAYPTYEELITLAAAAAVTERIGLMTDVLLATTREPVLLAKQAATLDQISHGRFILGVGVGTREDDFTITGFDHHTRGKRMDATLDLMHRAWRAEPLPGTNQPVTPKPVNGQSVPIMFGGHVDRAIARLAKYGIGYTLGGGTTDTFKGMMDRVNAIWQEAGRPGKPEFRALSYFALGEEVHEEAESNLRGYYADFGGRVWYGTVKSAAEAKERVKGFEAAGCDELLIFMAVPAVAQAERLAEAVL